jgi:orotate phosphoribosyltransferase
MGLADRIARASIESGAISINLEKPFTGASGIRFPVYNDNRMLLGSYAHRMLVAEGFADVIAHNGIQCDLIVGTSLSGIAPATTLAAKLSLPLAIIHDGRAYEPPLTLPVPYNIGAVDVIASTVPWAIPVGVTLANEQQLPFLYVRKARKEHGKEKRIEGKHSAEQKVHLLDRYNDSSYAQSALEALRMEGLFPEGFISMSLGLVPENVKGKRVLMIEDLINTGLSSGVEIATLRNMGATVEHCLATYSIRDVEDIDGAKLHLLVPYPTLLDQAEQTGFASAEQMPHLREWIRDPITWDRRYRERVHK